MEDGSDGTPGDGRPKPRDSDQPPVATLHWSAPAPGAAENPRAPSAVAGGARALEETWVPTPSPVAAEPVSSLGDTQLSHTVGAHAGVPPEVILHSPPIGGAPGAGGPRTGAAVLHAPAPAPAPRQPLAQGPPVSFGYVLRERLSTRWIVVAMLVPGLVVVAVVATLASRYWPKWFASSAAEDSPKLIAGQMGACRVRGVEKRYASKVSPRGSIQGTITEGGKYAAVGFVTTEGYGHGLEIDLESGAGRIALRDRAPQQAIGVLPYSSSSGLDFLVDREGPSQLSLPVSLPGAHAYQLGLTERGISLYGGKPGKPRALRPVWPLEAGVTISRPVVAMTSDEGHAVAFRSGGKSGKLRVGWLNARQRRGSELFYGPFAAAELGAPAMAARGMTAVLAVAVRPQTGQDWAIRLAEIDVGAGPQPVVEFEVPSGGPGHHAFAPRIAALGSDRWILQWTEGEPGSRMVRGMVLNDELRPVGEVLSLSMGQANAGMGALVSTPLGAVSLFLVQRSTGYEIWGKHVVCK